MPGERQCEECHASAQSAGYRVSIVQNPTTSLADDVAATKRNASSPSGTAP
jgi:hypothetical protein